MIFRVYFSVIHFSNCYVLGPREGGEAVLIDPGIFDEGLLELIEEHGFYVRHVLITHNHRSHVNGVKTLLKIYDALTYSLDPQLLDFPAERIHGQSRLELGRFQVEVLETPGHSNDSVCYRVGRMLFTGDTLSAGSVGETATSYERALLLSSIRNRILRLPGEHFVFPGHGPPTTLSAEREFNPYLRERL